MTAYKTVNPATGETLRVFPEATSAEVSDAIERAHKEFLRWRETPVASRAKIMARVAELYRERNDELAKIISLEMGKPLAQARGEVSFVADIFDYYAAEGPGFLQDELLDVKGGGEAIVRSAPVGV